MIPRLRIRAPGTRTARSDPRQRRLESLAGEFALLTQRRARTVHQIELLDRQCAAAAATLHNVQARLVWLVQQMDALDPELHATGLRKPEPEPPPLPPVGPRSAEKHPSPPPSKSTHGQYLTRPGLRAPGDLRRRP